MFPRSHNICSKVWEFLDALNLFKVCTITKLHRSTALLKLLHQLNDKDPHVQYAVFTALGHATQKGDHNTLNAIVNKLVFTSAVDVNDTGVGALPIVSIYTPWFVRVSALKTLAMIANQGDRWVIDQMLLVCQDSTENVRQAAMKAVAKVGEPGDESIINAAIRMLSDNNHFVRIAAVSALSVLVVSLTDYASIIEPIVCLALEEPCPDVRIVASDALNTIVTRVAVGDLYAEAINCVAKRMDHDSWIVREAAIKILCDIAQPGNEHAIALIIQRFQDTNWEVRIAALHAFDALSDLQKPTGTIAVQNMLEDHQIQVRTVARNVIAKWRAQGSLFLNCL